ncbi:unnamed protein product [Discula destructiva]
MIDFIFQVDLSIIYIIHRRDFASGDRYGSSTLPLGGRFYYTAAEANSAARQHCLREANKSLCGEAAVVHGEKDALYRGACVVKESGRDRFEVIVRQLKAAGSAVRGESRGSVIVGTAASARAGEERRRRFSWSESGSSGGSGSNDIERPAMRERRGVAGTGLLRAVEEEEGDDESSGMERCCSPTEKRRSLVGRVWETLKRK